MKKSANRNCDANKSCKDCKNNAKSSMNKNKQNNANANTSSNYDFE